MSDTPQTIFALASGAGRAGVAVVRVSGPGAFDAVRVLTTHIDTKPNPRTAVRVNLFEPESNGSREKIDDALMIWFPAPRSFTGEDVVELHVHGGASVIESLLTSLATVEGFRLAEPGEFSRRAFENGKLDLTAVEAIADLVDAETSAQRRQALTQMGGALAEVYDGWRGKLIEALAYLEVCIDFAEEDVPTDLMERSAAVLDTLLSDITGHLDDKGIGERIRDGFRIVLSGAPNVGKSSLMNALAKRDVAIVTDTAGTTRDVLEVHLDLDGYPAILIDTAGLRETDDTVEQEGVRRAKAQAETADIRILVLDATALSADIDVDPKTIVILNKCDLIGEPPDMLGGIPVLATSMVDGTGLQSLIDELRDRVAERALAMASEHPPLTRLRHRTALSGCAESLQRAKMGVTDGADLEMIAEDMRLAAQSLGAITGRVDVEDLLDKIFRDFCIGK